MTKFAKTFSALAIVLTSALPLAAQDAPKDAAKPEQASKPLMLKTLVAADEKVVMGDVITITRPFGDWTLNCDLRLSLNKRLCAVQQVAQNGQAMVLWRLATTDDDKPVVVLSVPKDFVADKGLRMGFSGLEKVIGGNDWRCSASGCVAAFPFDGLLQPAIMSAQVVKFGYSIKDDAGAETEVSAVGSMAGFAQALDAGSKDPFGKTVVAESPKDKEPVKKNDKKAALTPAKAPVQTAKLTPAKKPVQPVQTAKVINSHRNPKPVTVAVVKPQRQRVAQVAFYRAPLY